MKSFLGTTAIAPVLSAAAAAAQTNIKIGVMTDICLYADLAGSVLAAAIAGVLLAIFMIGTTWWVGLILAIALVGAATLGDLTESLIKRDLGIKDISTWLPGHGGFLDRLDSMLPSTVVAYLIFSIVAG